MSLETLRVDVEDRTAWVRLNRPRVHNAFNAAMVRELRETFERMAGDADVRVIVITGEGKSFCAGVDLKWLGSGRGAPRERHVEETLSISRMFRAAYELDKPVLAAVNGAALGGGVGFLGVADVVLAARDAVFGLSEVRIGVVPACIAPYLLLRSANRARLKGLFMGGGRFSAEEAEAAGLVEHIVEPGELIDKAREKAAELRNAAPGAQGVCKRLFREVPGLTLDAAMRHTAEILADLKMGEEARRGIDAFFDKKELSWD